MQSSPVKTLDPKLLDEVVRRIARAVQPERIYLYGSHAYGAPNADSDVDLLVLVEKSDVPYYQRTRPIYKARQVGGVSGARGEQERKGRV
ncbi:MAG: nucleotidyltransferase domain-containing protein [Chloroflexi bacterium]|nr:nucleotidyltransferase domain-containing protein [Chloroflexota bacterium]